MRPRAAAWIWKVIIESFYTTTLSTNLLSTLLLAFRIWTVDRQTLGKRAMKSPLRPVLSIVIDLGLLYSFTLAAALICFASESHGQIIILDTISPVISIAFYMVIIRVGIAQNWNDTRFEVHATFSLSGRGIGNRAT